MGKAKSTLDLKELYPWLVVVLLLVAYTLSFIDRQIISLLVDPIRRDLQISDTQISLLQGLAFAVFYTLMGIPIAKWADKRSRRNIIVVGMAVWSLMTALCGIAKSYWIVFLGRVGVGVGEAALSPASYSMIADYFRPDRLSTALSVYGAGPSIGSGLAYSVCIGALFLAPAVLGATVTDSASVSMIFVGGVFFCVAFPYGAGVAALQMATPPHFRAQVSAVYLFVNNFLGMALGPPAVALFTDYVFKDDSAVGVSIGVVGALAGIAAFACCCLTLRPLREILAFNHSRSLGHGMTAANAARGV